MMHRTYSKKFRMDLQHQSAVRLGDMTVEMVSLHTPPLDELSTVLARGLKKHFKEADVTVANCPDLTQSPFNLLGKGLAGKPTMVEIGGASNLIPRPKKEKIYDLLDVSRVVNVKPCIMLGAAAGPWPHTGCNCELMITFCADGLKSRNRSKYSKVEVSGLSGLYPLPESETRCSILANILCSSGQEGPVLKVRCATRLGRESFVTAIRGILNKTYRNKHIGLGGVFMSSKGYVKAHVMPDFSKEDITSDELLNEWLKFYEFSTPFLSMGTLISKDPGCDVRLQHFHGYNTEGQGGHFHNDTTPATIEYHGLFTVCETLYRIDRPKSKTSYGQD